MLNLELH